MAVLPSSIGIMPVLEEARLAELVMLFIIVMLAGRGALSYSQDGCAT